MREKYYSLTEKSTAYKPSEHENSRFAIPSDKDKALTNGYSTAKDIIVYLYIINKSIRQAVAPRSGRHVVVQDDID